MRRSLLLAVLAVTTACGRGGDGTDQSATTAATASSATSTAGVEDASEVVIRYRVERRTADPATGDFARLVETTLGDPRGWVRGGFRFVSDPDGPFLVVLAEGAEVDRLCRPYDTYGRYSCQNGAVVAVNADRWRTATPEWTGDLASYRQMLVNHEVGHLIGMHHPDVQCPATGEAAPVMAQQSTELDDCLPNPWPLDAEIERVARHDLKIAPEFGE